MKKSLILVSAFAVLGTGFLSIPAGAASFEYSPPMEVGFNNNNNHELKFRGFEQDKLEERNSRVSCVGPCEDRNKTLFFLPHQTIANLPLVTGTTEVVSSSSIDNQSVSVSHESIVNETVDSAQ
ncbi:hypothetical protein [Advenella alkanexedens]|uniref:hypothetical protein n=1 Tax=Advenella alkanexedens TaxID=1481665 RepID=UPI001698941E|nr:hypothetical protein [Advenella alkanexedens]NLY33981.1 hypothetical protein [Alcaligenaceae bacterium]WKU19277.1 hypothetical protein Q3V95_13485 [Advenella alkanexedens]